MIESGPASGVWGAAALGRLIGEQNAIAIDIGGTTAKCGLIIGGQVKLNTNYMVERTELSAGYPVMVPVVDLVEIGNGGGSIAWVDEFQRLHVGPPERGGGAGARRPMAPEEPKPPPRTRTSRWAASIRTTSAAARSRLT